MKLLQTGSVAVVNDCQTLFHLLPITCQIDVRTAKFLQKFIANDNSICNLFSKQAEVNLKKVFLRFWQCQLDIWTGNSCRELAFCLSVVDNVIRLSICVVVFLF